jgi:CheY-like chemotaxis protein
MAERKKILLIDDEEDFCFFVKGNLENTGEFEVITATRGKKGIELARSELPDLILLDIAMPGMYGDEVASILVSSDKTKEIPIVFLTAMVSEDEVKEGIPKKIGGRRFIAKPITTEQLVAAIKEVLEL